MELLTLQDVALELKVSIHTVRDWRKRGWLKVYKLPGGSLRVRRADIDGLLQEATATA